MRNMMDCQNHEQEINTSNQTCPDFILSFYYMRIYWGCCFGYHDFANQMIQ